MQTFTAKLFLHRCIILLTCLLSAFSLHAQALAATDTHPAATLAGEYSPQQGQQSLERALTLTSEHFGVFFNYYPEAIRRYSVTLPDLEKLTLSKALKTLLRKTDLGFRRTAEAQVIIAPKSDIRALPEYSTGAEPVKSLRGEPTAPGGQPRGEARAIGSVSQLEADGGIGKVLSTVGVTGRVQDEDGVPMIGVSVLVDGTGTGAVTDVDGVYSLDLDDLDGTLIFSYLGFETQRVAINGRSIINVTLAPSDALLEEVVVIGYGTRGARDLTGAVSAVGAEEIERSPNISPESAIQGRLPGVYISTPGGNPGGRPEVQIRGIGTFGNAEPLYVIDGVPITEFGTGVASNSRAGDLRGNINILSFINPADIESVSVLKDASAAAIYGVRAANGVILITTKKGQKGAPRVSVDASYGFQEPVNTYDVLNVDQYVDLYTDAFNNDPNEELPAIFDPGSPSYLGNNPNTDWQEEVLNPSSTVQNYGVRISGGSESTTYYLSGGYSYQESPLRENDLARYSFAGNFDSQISDYIRAGVNFRTGFVDANDNSRGNLDDAAEAPPWQPIYDADGNPAVVQGITFEPNPNFNPNDATTGALFNVSSDSTLYGPETSGNPIGLQLTTDNTYTILRNLGTAFLEVEPLEGLRFRGTLSADYYTNRQDQFIAFDRYLYTQVPRNPYSGQDGSSNGSTQESVSRNFNLVKEFSINFARSFGSHNLDVLLNATDQQYSFQNTTARTGLTILTDPNLRTLNGPNAFTELAGQREQTALQGYMARVGYNFKNRYYLDVTVRRDGSSRFSPDFRWGTFPSVAVAWRLSDEPFMQNQNFFGDLKLRAGWGQLGNQETSAFAFLSTVSFTPDYAFGSGNGNSVGGLQFGARLPDLPNPLLTWETAETVNIGLDAYALRDRLTFTIEYYDRTTRGIIQPTQLAPSIGNEADPILNVAQVGNSGFEFSAGYRNQIGDFSYGVSANFTTVKNEVEELQNGEAFNGFGGRIEEGQPLGYIWGYKVGGIFRDQAEVDAYFANTTDEASGNTLAPGDIFFQDLATRVTGEDGTSEIVMTPDGVVNEADRVFLGSQIPGHYYGFNLDVGYSSFDLAIFFQGVGDVRRFNSERASFECMCGRGDNQFTTVLDRWTPENRDASLPRAVVSSPGNSRFSDRFVEDAGFLRLRNVQLGYRLPPGVLNSLDFLSSARFYVTGTNIFTLTDWTGIDPESNDAFSGGVVPPTRAIVFGLNASF